MPVLVMPAPGGRGLRHPGGEPPALRKATELWSGLLMRDIERQLPPLEPLILGPVAAEPPFPPGADLTDEWRPARILRAFRLVVPMNLLGLPAVVVPVGAAASLPQVVQIIGPARREDRSLDAAEGIEERHLPITSIDPRLPASAAEGRRKVALSSIERTPSKASWHGAAFVSAEQHPIGD